MGSVNAVSFYSYKGGTGRSTGLANISYELAKLGKTVACIDFDLSAPGLHSIYDISPKKIRSKKSVHDYIDEGGNSNIEDHIIRLGKEYEEVEGELMLVQGELSPKIAAALDGERHRHIKSIVSDLEIEHRPDYIFFDSRSGISNQAVPIFKRADMMLTFAKWTPQHRQGTDTMLSWMFGQKATQVDNIKHVIPVLSNVPVSLSEDEVENWIGRLPYQVSFEDYRDISESNLLKRRECILSREEDLEESDKKVVEQYKEIANLIDKK